MSGADQIVCEHGVPLSAVCPKCIARKTSVPLNGRAMLPDVTPPQGGTQGGTMRATLGVVIGLCHVCGHAITAKVALATDPKTGRPVQGARTDPHRRSPIIGAPMCEGSNLPVNIQFIEAAGTADRPQKSKYDCNKCEDTKHMAILQRPPLQRGFRIVDCPECQESKTNDEGKPIECIHEVSLEENCEPCMDIVKRKVGTEEADRIAQGVDN